MNNEEKKEFSWRCRIFPSSNIGQLLNYINNSDLHPQITKNEIIIKALSAYYLPKSLTSERSPEQLKRIAYESVFALRNQIEELIFEFDLEVSILESTTFANNVKGTQKEIKLKDVNSNFENTTEENLENIVEEDNFEIDS